MNNKICECGSQENNWFSTNIRYEGQGLAEFLDPAGFIQGFVKIEFNETGKATLEMEIENWKADRKLQFGLRELFSPETAVDENGQIKFYGTLGNKTNPCTSLTVTTSIGTYIASEKVFYNYQMDLLNLDRGRIKFFLPLSQFKVADGKQSKYWIIPLFNFVSEFQRQSRVLDKHLLRLQPIYDSNNSTNLDCLHNYLFSKTNAFLTFHFKNKLGFIAPLPDFYERENKLISGKIQRTITAIMVGEVGSSSVTPLNFREELPFEFLVLLGLATGSEVGAAWIEIRDENGNLVQRIHTRFSQLQFSRGHKTIDEITHQGIGELLTQSQSSTFYKKPPLFPVIADLIQGGLYQLAIEDKLTILCRALDHLCKYYKVDRQNLIQALNTRQQREITEILKKAGKDIRNVSQGVKDSSQSPILSRIVERVNNAANIERNFGISVVDLLVHFNLPDAQIIDTHYQANPRADERKTWAEVLSYYRGAAVHLGYFDLKSGEYDIHDLVRVTNHLHDILIRIVFKMLGYNGMYQPPISTIPSPVSIDWVTLATPASNLGY